PARLAAKSVASHHGQRFRASRFHGHHANPTEATNKIPSACANQHTPNSSLKLPTARGTFPHNAKAPTNEPTAGANSTATPTNHSESPSDSPGIRPEVTRRTNHTINRLAAKSPST